MLLTMQKQDLTSDSFVIIILVLEHPSWIFADVIETNIAAGRISRIEVLTFLRNRGWNTPYEKSLELGTEVERSVVEAANSNAANPV